MPRSNMKNGKEIETYLRNNNISNLIVLCRGKSIEKFINFSNEGSDDNCILFVNKFSELAKNEKLMKSIKNNSVKPNVQYINNDYFNLEKASNLDMFDVNPIE
jgi:hypothetical protein